MKAFQSEEIASRNGKSLYWITLENDNGIRVQVTNLGCIIQSVVVPDKFGNPTDVTLGFDRVEDYYSDQYLADCPYFGAIVGRYANRIGNASYEYDGQTFQLSRNDGKNQLHGGGSFSHRVWDIDSVDNDEAAVTFTLYSPDGEEGFPGNMNATVTYKLTNNNELIYTVKAAADQPTPVNVTNHAYFNLHGDGSFIGDHLLEIAAGKYFAQHEDLVVTGDLLPVAETVYDFTVPRRIDQRWNEQTGFDQAFELSKEYGKWGFVARASSLKTGITLEILTEEPVVQLYTGGFLNGQKGKGGVAYGKFSGFCLETHHHPNAVNIPHFPDTVLRIGDVYQQKTAFKFGVV